MSAKVPFKLLLQPNKQGQQCGRSEQQIEILSQLCIHSKIFQYLGLAKNTLRQICNKLTLIWADNPHVNEIYENEVYLILEGKAYEYLQNKNAKLQSKLNSNQQYLMVRKLVPNDFFVVYTPPIKQIDDYDDRKYQLMIDKQTLVAKVTGETYWKYFMPLIENRYKKITNFLRKVKIFQSLEQAVLYEVSKYMEATTFEAGTQIIKQQTKNAYVYYIINGEIQYKIFSTLGANTNKNFQAVNNSSKLIKRSILREYDVFGIDSFHSSTYEELPMDYFAAAKTNCSVYQIDKRILAIVISSFENAIQKNHKASYSSVNLNDQIQGQCYQTSDMALLTRNAEKIKTSEKKIRDIKLRFFNTSHKMRGNKFFNQSQNQRKQIDFEDFQNLKYQSCQSFIPMKLSKQSSKYFEPMGSTYRKQLALQGNQDINNRRFSSIILSVYNEDQKQKQVPRHNQTQDYFKKSRQFSVKRKSEAFIKTGGKEESDIIKIYLEKKLKNEMLKKAELILQRNTQQRFKQTSKIKRMYGSRSMKSLSLHQKQGKNNNKQIGDQLYNRMARLTQIPLLSIVEGERKRMQMTASKIKQSLRLNRKIQKQFKNGAASANRDVGKEKQPVIILN